MQEQVKKNSMSSVAPLLLFAIFATCIVMVLLSGANIYQKLVNRDQASYQHRTTAQYITTRVRQSDCADVAFIGDFSDLSGSEEGNTLFLCEILGGRTFFTRIYCHEGYVRELFSEAGVEFIPADGEKLLEANDLYFSMEDGLLTVSIEHADGLKETVVLSLHSGKEVAP